MAKHKFCQMVPHTKRLRTITGIEKRNVTMFQGGITSQDEENNAKTRN